MKNIKIVIFSMLVLFAFVACESSGDMKASVLSVDGIADIQGFKVIDVRTAEEFQSGCIDGAENIDVQSSDFSKKISEMDKDEKYLVYCRSGRRSSQAVELMKNAGFENITNLDGGVLNWEAQGNELSQNCG